MARFDLLLIDGGGGFDCENIKFARYPCSCFGSDCENVKFDSGFALVLGSTCTLGFFNLFFGSYHSVFITEFSKHVGPTKKFLFGLVFNLCFHHSKLKNLF